MKTIHGDTLTAREAARMRQPLDGADAQALEGALSLTERERDKAEARVRELEAERDEARLTLSEIHRTGIAADKERAWAERDALAAKLLALIEAVNEREAASDLYRTTLVHEAEWVRVKNRHAAAKKRLDATLSDLTAAAAQYTARVKVEALREVADWGDARERAKVEKGTP